MGGEHKNVSKSTKSRKSTTANRASRAKGEPAAPPGARGDRSKRLLDLVMLLMRARAPVTFREIREQFTSYQTDNIEAGLRAFERDKADLLELGVPVRYVTPEEDDGIEEGGYIVDLKRFRLPEVHLTADEVSALVLAASVAHAVPGDVSYARIVDLALKKLSFDLPEQPDPDTPLEWPPPASTLTRRERVLVHFPTGTARHARELSDRFAELESATRNRKRVTLRYQSASTGYVQTRDLFPYGLFYREGSWLVVGYCHLRKDVRSFRLDRIVDLTIAPKPKSPDFDRPADFEIKSFANRSPWTFRPVPVEPVELEILPEAASVANEDFGADATVTRGEGGGARVNFSCGNPDYTVSRVLAAKGAILVRQGERVSRMLQDELVRLRETYR